MLRQQAQSAIRQWHDGFGLSQKTLAAAVGVSDTTISRCLNLKEPEWGVSDDTLRKIIRAVKQEAFHRVLPFELKVIAYCHGQDFKPSEFANQRAIASIRRAFSRGSYACKLPDNCRGALVRLGPPESLT